MRFSRGARFLGTAAVAWAAAGCAATGLRELDDGTHAMVRLDYVAAEPPLKSAVGTGVEKAVALEDDGIALAMIGHVEDGVAELDKASRLFSMDDRSDQQQVLYAIGRAWQTTRDCAKTKQGYERFIAYASRFPDQKSNVLKAQQDVAIACKQPGALQMKVEEEAASAPAGGAAAGVGGAAGSSTGDTENPLGK